MESGQSRSWFPIQTMYGTEADTALISSKNSSHYEVEKRERREGGEEEEEESRTERGKGAKERERRERE